MENYGGYKEQSYAGIVTNNHSNGILYKCKNYGNLVVDEQGAGICLNNSGKILYCENYGTIETDYYSDKSRNYWFHAAGIALNNNGLVVGSINLGTLRGGAQAGICYQNTGNGIIRNCYNVPNLNWDYAHSSPGIVHHLVGGIVEYCYDIGNNGVYNTWHQDLSTINECYNWYGKEYSDLGEDYITKWNEAQGMTIWKEDTEGINNGYPILNQDVKYILEKEERTEVTVIMTVYDKNLLTPDINQFKEKIIVSIEESECEDIEITLAETPENVLKVTVKAILPQIVTGDLKVKLEEKTIFDKAGNSNDTIENVLNEEIKIQAKPSITVNVPTIGQKALLEVTNTNQFDLEKTTWQWYAKENDEVEEIAIEGATTAKYELSAEKTFELEGYRIYCVATIEEKEYKSNSEILAINYSISTEEELIGVRDLVNAGKTLENKTVSLVNNIEITTNTWEPINDFAGTFDGQGNEISKLPNSLFGDNNGIIRNLGVDANIELPSETRIGILTKVNVGTIQNCHTKGSITGDDQVGGITGLNCGTIEDCYNNATITGNWAIGGIAGQYNLANTSTVINSYNTGNITGDYDIGGITGHVWYGTMYNCYNVGNISGNDNVGGITGKCFGTIENCYNVGSITGYNEVGRGIIGNSSWATITNCYYNSETSGVTDENATAKTTEEMKEPTFVLALGIENWKEDTGYLDEEDNTVLVNEGYPILKWQEGRETVIIEEQEVTQNSIKIKATATDVNYKYYKVSIDGQNYEEIIAQEGLGYIEKEFTNLTPGTTYTVTVNAYSDNSYAEETKIEGQKEIKTVFIPSVITTQTVKVGYEARFAVGTLPENAVISWYRNTEDSTETGTLINGATSAEYVESAANAVLYDNNYYYSVITLNGTEYVSNTLQLTVDYEIETKEQLGKMRDLVSSYSLAPTITGLKGKTVILGNDIDLNPGFTFKEDGTYEIDSTKTALTAPEQWTPIGNEIYNQTGFEGTFDGQGHTIEGIYINATGDEQGLFGRVGNFSEIKNLTVDGSITGSDNVGGIAGRNYNGKIVNCHNKGSIKGNNSVGGILGRGSSTNTIVTTLQNCSNEGIVEGKFSVGGIIGNFETDTNGGLALTNCSNEGTIKGELYVGGISGNAVPGINTNDIIKITNCYNVGSITGTNYVGGIAGRNYSGTIANCYNEGSVTGQSTAGGISGYIYTGIITNCYNKASIAGENYVGGILGQEQYTGTISKCYNEGEIVGAEIVGGIAGNVSTIYGCYNIGNISGNATVGGIIGLSGYVSGCYNVGNVIGSESVGGIAGQSNGGIDYSYNVGSITGEGEYIGGIAGNNYIGKIRNCYNVGSINVVNYNSLVGGIAGGFYTGTIENSYYNSETSGVTDKYATAKTSDEMKDPSFVLALGIEGWKQDTNNINEGYPILKWQEGRETVIIEEQEVTQNSIKIKATATDSQYTFYKYRILTEEGTEVEFVEGGTNTEYTFTDLQIATYIIEAYAYKTEEYNEEEKIYGKTQIITGIVKPIISLSTTNIREKAIFTITNIEEYPDDATFSWYVVTNEEVPDIGGSDDDPMDKLIPDNAEYVNWLTKTEAGYEIPAENVINYIGYEFYVIVGAYGRYSISEGLKLTVEIAEENYWIQSGTTVTDGYVKLTLGDYVAYKPQTASTSYKIESKYSGYSSDQTISQEDLGWRVLGVKDGRLELISDTATTTDIYLESDQGYNNGVYLINDMSNTLYGNTDNGTTARGLAIEDIENAMNEIPEYDVIIDQYEGPFYNWPYELDCPAIVSLEEYESLQRSEQLELIETGNPINITGMTINKWSTSQMTGENFKYDIYYNLFMNESYYLASRSRYVADEVVSEYYEGAWVEGPRFYGAFGLTYISSNTVTQATIACRCYNSTWEHINNSKFRPVVTLGQTVVINDSNSSRDGSSKDKAYTISW